MRRIDQMFHENGYEIVAQDMLKIRVEKKHFNIGILFMMFGLFSYFGVFAYLIYFRWFLRPRRLCVDLEAEEVLYRCDKER